MQFWEQELALTEAAALRIEAIEAEAERRFDKALAVAEGNGEPGIATRMAEFRDWMSARADTDAAWGRWAEVMHARPASAARD